MLINELVQLCVCVRTCVCFIINTFSTIVTITVVIFQQNFEKYFIEFFSLLFRYSNYRVAKIISRYMLLQLSVIFGVIPILANSRLKKMLFITLLFTILLQVSNISYFVPRFRHKLNNALVFLFVK